MWQDSEENGVSTQEFEAVWSQVFNFCSMRLVIVATLKTESSQKVDTCEYKIDTGIDDKVKPI